MSFTIIPAYLINFPSIFDPSFYLECGFGCHLWMASCVTLITCHIYLTHMTFCSFLSPFPPVDLHWFFEISIRTEKKFQWELKKNFSYKLTEILSQFEINSKMDISKNQWRSTPLSVMTFWWLSDGCLRLSDCYLIDVLWLFLSMTLYFL